MNTNRIMRSKLYRFLDYVLRLVLLNALVVLPSFSFFIIYATFIDNPDNWVVNLALIPILLLLFPSIIACFDVIRQYETDETNTIFKDFFKSFKKFYIKSLLISIVIIIVLFLLINSILFFYNYAAKGMIYLIGLILTVSFTIIFLMILVHICLVMVYFKNLQFVEIVKFASIMAFKDILTTLVIIILVALIISLNIAFYIVLAIGGISIPIYLTIKLSLKQYIKLYRKVGNKDE